MTTDERFDRTVADWLLEDARHRVPDHLAEVLGRTSRTRQRPWWSSHERWLPVNIPLRRSVFGQPTRFGQIALLLVIGLLVAAFVAIAVGTHRSVPAPYGLARNGAIVASHDGDIYAIDPATSASSLMIGGDAFDFAPTYSRDGSQFLFVRSATDPANDRPLMLALMVANADGSGLRALTDPVEEMAWFDWSPNGSQIAYVHSFGTITVVNVDGSGSTTLVTRQPAHFVAWLPPDGTEILYRGDHVNVSEPPLGIFAIRPDGKSPPRKITNRPANDPSDYQSLTVAPDGSRISYSRFASNGTPSVLILDLLTGGERVLPAPTGTSQRGGAVFSPDATLVAYSRIYADGTYQLVVAPADGSTEGNALGPRMSGTTEGTTYTFTPDGSAVIAGFGQDDGQLPRRAYRLPVDGSAGSVLSEGGTFSFTDMQRLAP
jgi:Tol biopolymer transport system component